MVDFTFGFYNQEDWVALSMAVASFSVIVSVMLIMLSRLFSLRNLEQVAKTEFVYAASTVMIVLMVAGILLVAETGINQKLAPCLYLTTIGADCNNPNIEAPLQETLIDWMKLYMESPAHCVSEFMTMLYPVAIIIDGISSVYIEIFMSEQAGGFGLKWISERIMNATQTFTFYMYAFYIMVHIFNFIKYYAGTFFSIGVILRAFPPSRGAGAYVMALAFGLYFIFPLAYITIATLSLPFVQSTYGEINAGGVDPTATACGVPQPIDVGSLSCGSENAARTWELKNLLRANELEIMDIVTVRIDDFGRHLVHSICIFPLIAFTAMLAFVLNATNLFGGNIPEVGRGIVKLI